MDPTRWKKIEELFNATLALPRGERDPFLLTACGDDHSLRSEIDSLLTEADQPDKFLSESGFAIGARLLTDEPKESLAGQTLGAYTIIRRIGRGGMGEVYLARDERLGRKVAIKLLPKRLIEDEERIRRFKHEARAASAISHPNVAHVYEIGEAQARLFTAMEFVSGATLRERFARKALSVGEAIDIATQVSLAINAAHSQGIIHRDIKPENIMIRPDGLVKVVDFGLAKLSEPIREAADHDSRETQIGARITREIHTEPGLLLGTATYMSPEQARGQEIDARTDIWSWGVVFFEMLAGEPPFNGATNSDIIAEILKSEPSFAHPTFRALPESATTILRRTLSKDRAGRYAEIEDLVAALRELQHQLENKDLLGIPLPVGLGTSEPSESFGHGGSETPSQGQANALPTNLSSLTQRVPLGAKPAADRQSRMRSWLVLASITVLITGVVIAGLLIAKWNSRRSAGATAASNHKTLSEGVSIRNQFGVEMVYVPPGMFTMGSNNGDADEKPVHQVTIRNGFYIGRYEITQTQWQAVMGNNPSFFKGDNLPVDMVSWNDAHDFIARLNKLADGYSYRLPTEAEWEYACRAGSSGDFGGPLNTTGWYYDNAEKGSHPVGQKEPNAFGLYDMYGNVWEWCEDWYHQTYDGAPVDGSAWLTGGEQKVRLLRGGSWYDLADRLRASHRGGNPPVLRGLNLGLRVVATPAG